MEIETLELQVGNIPGFKTNCYIISESNQSPGCVVIDPASSPERIQAALRGRSVEAIVITHRHSDHTGALAELARACGAPIYAHSLDATELSDERENGSLALGLRVEAPEAVLRLEEGDSVSVGSQQLVVLHTPGHTIGSICLHSPENNVLFSGDTLFFGTTGRTDLPTGNPAQMHASLLKLALLPDETKVYPGHDRPTSIGRERSRALTEY